MSRNLQISLAFAFVVVLVVALVLLAAWWEHHTEAGSEALEGEVLDDTQVLEAVVLDPVDPLTDELWTFARDMEPPRIFDEIVWVKAWDFAPELEMAA